MFLVEKEKQQSRTSMKTMLNAAWKCISKEGSAPYEDPNMTQIQEFTEETNPNIICV